MIIKKLLFIALVDLNAKEFIGIKKKIKGQTEAFDSFGDCDLLYVKGKSLFLNENKVLDFSNYKEMFTNVLNSKLMDDYDLIYVRHLIPTSFNFFNFLRKIKMKYNPKLILEIPTYPYFNESKNFTDRKIKLNFYVDQLIFSKLLSNYVNYVVTFNYFEDTVFNIRNIKLVNGVSENQIELIKSEKTSSKELNILAVSTLVSWHGYDRLIKGLGEYIHKSNQYMINLHFVGEGPEKNNLEELSRKLSLDKNVFFYGYKTGDELEAIYKKADIGVSSLGLYRKNGAGDSLKAKEYMLAGLPIIVDENEKYYVGKDFVLDIQSNDTPINFEEVIHFYHSIKSNGVQIRKYCLENFSWKSQIRKLLEFIK